MYRILEKSLPRDRLVQFYDVLQHNESEECQSTTLVMEDFSGVDLLSFLCDRGPLSPSAFLKVATKVALLLSQIHTARVLHLNVQPTNILYSSERDSVRIIDFASARVCSAQKPCVVSSQMMFGNSQRQNVFYLSPEQRGLTSDPIDTRADIFSLGMTFYTLLTGETLLQEESGEICVAPISLIAPEVPPQIAAIVHKMIQKESRRRYPNMHTVYSDLEQLSSHYEKHRELSDTFVPGKKDFSDDSFNLSSDVLYGRENHLEELSAIMEQCLRNERENGLIVLRGELGSGRSSLVNHLVKHQKDVALLCSKCDEYKSCVPFHPFAEIFRQIVHMLTSFHPMKMRLLRKKFSGDLTVSEINAMRQLAPEVDMLFEVKNHEESSQTQKTRSYPFNQAEAFCDAAEKFFCAAIDSTCRKRLMIVHISNVQHADQQSLSLLSRMSSSRLLSPKILLILSVSTTPGQRIDKFFNVVTTHTHPHSVQVDPLSMRDTNALVADSLVLRLQQTEEFTKNIHSKTQGNPLFTREYLLWLYQNDNLAYNLDTNSWNPEADALEEDGSQNDISMYDLVSRRIEHQATSASLHVLFMAAVIGRDFSLHILSSLCEDDEASLLFCMSQGFLEGWIEDIEHLFYTFSDDFVREAFYMSQSQIDRRKVHYKLSLIYFRIWEEHSRAIHLNESVNHLWHCLTSRGHEDTFIDNAQCSRILLTAAKMSTTSPSLCAEYCSMGRALLNITDTPDTQTPRSDRNSMHVDLILLDIESLWQQGLHFKSVEKALWAMDRASTQEDKDKLHDFVLHSFRMRSKQTSGAAIHSPAHTPENSQAEHKIIDMELSEKKPGEKEGLLLLSENEREELLRLRAFYKESVGKRHTAAFTIRWNERKKTYERVDLKARGDVLPL